MCLFPAEAKIIHSNWLNTRLYKYRSTSLNDDSFTAVGYAGLGEVLHADTIITDTICSKGAWVFEMHITVSMVSLNTSMLVIPRLFRFVVTLHQCLKHFTVTIVSPLIGVIFTDLRCCF